MRWPMIPSRPIARLAQNVICFGGVSLKSTGSFQESVNLCTLFVSSQSLQRLTREIKQRMQGG